MKKYIFVPLLALSFSPFAQGATDAYLKIDGIKGETTSAPPRATTSSSVAAPKDEQEGQTDAFLKIKGIEGETEETKKKGNVEYDWKVEEGQKVMVEGEAVAPDFSILLGGGGRGTSEEAVEEVEKMLTDGAKEEGLPVEQISLNFEKIQTKLSTEMKFLGLFPLSTKATVEIDAEGRVKVKFPWWAGVSSDKEDKEKLGERVYTTLSNVMKTKHDTIKNSINNVR